MQFQPYKGGGGPDFLSLALNLRQQRNREESQRRRDEADLIRARTAAMTAAGAEKRAAAKEERDAVEFRLKELGLRRDALNAIRPDFLATQEAVGERMDQAAQQFESQTTDTDREVIAGESEFARIVNEADPNFVAQRMQPLRQAFDAGQEAMAPLYAQLRGIDATETDIRNRERGRRLQVDEEFYAGDPGDLRAMGAVRRERDAALADMSDPNLPPGKRQALLDRARDAQGRLNRLIREGVTIDDRELTAAATQQTIAVAQGQSMLGALDNFINMVEADPSVIGAGARLGMLASDVTGAAGSIAQRVGRFFQATGTDPAAILADVDRDQLASKEAKSWLRRLESNSSIMSGNYQEISDLRALGDLIALSVVRLNAGDRISTPIFEKFARQFDFDAATDPEALIRQMRTARAVLDAQVQNADDILKLKYVNSPFLDPITRLQLEDARSRAERSAATMQFPSLGGGAGSPRVPPPRIGDAAQLSDEDLLRVFGLSGGAGR